MEANYNGIICKELLKKNCYICLIQGYLIIPMYERQWGDIMYWRKRLKTKRIARV